jgi:hypothetical protein
MFTADSFIFIDDVTAYINISRITQSIADDAIMFHSVRICRFRQGKRLITHRNGQISISAPIGRKLKRALGCNAPGNQLTAPDKHKNRCGRALKTLLVYSVNEI